MRGLVPTISTLSRHHSPEPSHQNRGRPVESDRNQTHIKKWVLPWNTISKFVFSILFELKNPLNVLVLGPHDSGKTTVINSLLMAVRKQWTDRARYGHGGRHQFAPVLLYENPNHHRRHNGQSYHNHEWVFFRITYHRSSGYHRHSDTMIHGGNETRMITVVVWLFGILEVSIWFLTRIRRLSCYDTFSKAD